MRIHVCTSLNYGGTESQLLEAAKTYAFQERTSEINFWALGESGNAGAQISELGFTVRNFGFDSRKISIRPILKIVKEFRKVRPNEVFTHGFEANLLIIPLAKLFRVKCLIAEEIGYPSRGILLKLILRFNYSISRFLTVQSIGNADYLVEKKQIVRRKLKILHPPVEKEMNKKREIGDAPYNKFIYLGRLEKVKNVEFIINGFHSFRKITGDHSWTLRIYGAGTQSEELFKLTEQLGLGENISFEGVTSGSHKVLIEADWLILASDTEGFGIVIIEAMQNGVPVISTPVGIATTVLNNGINGYIYPHNSLTKFNEVLKSAVTLSSPEYQTMSVKASDSVKQRFSGESYIDKLDGMAGGEGD